MWATGAAVALTSALGVTAAVAQTGTIAGASSLSASRSASTTASNPGITASSITVGQVDTLSGPVPGLFQGAKDGTEAYLAYVNSQGGVNGRKIKLDVEDDAFSGANYTTDTQQLVKRDFALVGGFSLFDDSGVPAINAARIPDITESLSQARAEDQYNYAPDPLVVGGSRLGPLKYYKKKFPSAIKHVGTFDANVAVAETQTKAVLSAMSSLGYQIGYRRTVTPFDTNFVPDALKMKAAGVQMVYVVGLAVNQVADLAKDMAQQNFRPQIFSTNGVAYDSSFVTQAGAAANGAATDLQSSLYLGQDAKAVPAVALFDKWLLKVDPKAHVDTYGLYGWAAAQLFVQALRSAGPEPTRTSLIAQLNKITNFTASGLTAAGNPAQKVPEMCWILAKVQNGRWVRSGPSPKTGFTCSPGGYFYPPGYKPFVRHD